MFSVTDVHFDALEKNENLYIYIYIHTHTHVIYYLNFLTEDYENYQENNKTIQKSKKSFRSEAHKVFTEKVLTRSH